jgi:excisionase family DNA binding protein
MKSISIVRAALQADPDITKEQRDTVVAALSGKHIGDKPISPLLSQAGAARYLNCSRFTIWRMVKDGTLHPVTIRGLVRYKRVELEKIAGLR